MGYATAKRAFSFQDFDRAHAVGPSYAAGFWKTHTQRQSFRESEIRGAIDGISERLDKVLGIVASMPVVKGLQHLISMLVHKLIANSILPPLPENLQWNNIMNHYYES